MPKPIGAAQLASISRFGFRTRQVETVLSVATTAGQLVNNNPDRVSLLLILEGTNSVFVGRNGQVTIVSGIPLLSQWNSILWDPAIDGEASTYERWAIASVGASNVRVIETVRLEYA